MQKKLNKISFFSSSTVTERIKRSVINSKQFTKNNYFFTCYSLVRSISIVFMDLKNEIFNPIVMEYNCHQNHAIII